MILMDFVLISILAIQNPSNGKIELQYSPLDYYTSMSECNIERNKLQKRQTTNKLYLCLKVDRN